MKLRIILSVILGGLWAWWSSALQFAAGLGGGNPSELVSLTLTFPTGLSLLIWGWLGGPSVVDNYDFFWLVLPLILGILAIFCIITIIQILSKAILTASAPYPTTSRILRRLPLIVGIGLVLALLVNFFVIK